MSRDDTLTVGVLADALREVATDIRANITRVENAYPHGMGRQLIQYAGKIGETSLTMLADRLDPPQAPKDEP